MPGEGKRIICEQQLALIWKRQTGQGKMGCQADKRTCDSKRKELG
jgi:hypothetical protein